MSETLLIWATAPVHEAADGLRLDVKFVEGMSIHVAHWPGRVRCVLRRDTEPIPFGSVYDPATLGFDLVVLDPGAQLEPAMMDDVAAVFAALDDAGSAALLPLARARGAAVVYSLEYTLGTRLQILRLDRQRGWPRKLWSMLWSIRQEHYRRAAVRAADGLQCNGYPAFDQYRRLNSRTLMFLDNRMTHALMATDAEMEARARRLRSNAPLRLIYSGRLEPMKGAQDLLPVMAALLRAGVHATLDIFGTGSLETTVRDGLSAFDGAVRLHAPVDFETRLVPFSRSAADVFVSCHRQGDPSCTYLEAMGCGLAVAGYANPMWSRLSAEAGAGAVVSLGQVEAMAMAIARWDRSRDDLVASAEACLGFARDHDFESEFARRMAHLKTIALDEPASHPDEFMPASL